MYYSLITYATYLVVGLALVLWAGKRLFPDDPALGADGRRDGSSPAGASGRFLVPGFYAANFVSIALNFETGLIRPMSVVETLQALGAKLGMTAAVVAATALIAAAVMRPGAGPPTERSKVRNDGRRY